MTHARVTLIYWRAAALCAVLGVAAAELASGGWLPARAGAVVRVIASYAPFVTFVGLVIASLVISARVRRFAAAQGLDQP